MSSTEFGLIITMKNITNKALMARIMFSSPRCNVLSGSFLSSARGWYSFVVPVLYPIVCYRSQFQIIVP